MSTSTLIMVRANDEERSFPGVIRELRHRTSAGDVVLTDGGSSDLTGDVAAELGAIVARLVSLAGSRMQHA